MEKTLFCLRNKNSHRINIVDSNETQETVENGDHQCPEGYCTLKECACGGGGWLRKRKQERERRKRIV